MAKKILLADDSITIQKVVELTFSEGDYQVVSVGNGALALQKIQEIRPDIALLDVIMPEANGYDVCENVKRNPETSWIPVLLLTGTFEPFDRKRAEAAGANGHLTKPFESQVLISKVEELIRAAQHPVAESTREDQMEIVAGGTLRPGRSEEPAAPEPKGWAAPAETAEELTRHSIVPDRFDVHTPPGEAPPAFSSGEEEDGVRTVRIAPESSSRPAFPSEDARAADEEDERETSPPVEPWDELASGLTAAPAASSEAVSPAVPTGESVFRPPDEPSRPAPELAEIHFAPAEALPGEAVGAAPAIPAPFAVAGGELPPGEVDRIASRVVEQLSDRVIREIAWEVIPELAETLIRRRIRELEEKISREG